MRVLVLLLVLSWAVGAFQSSVMRTESLRSAPIQPVRTVETKSDGTTSRTTLTRNVNGREVPIESVEERVLSDANGVRISERVIRRFDANGNPGPPERIRIETRTEGDTVRTLTTVLRTDLNGATQLAERSTAVTRSSAAGSETTVLVERPAPNGGFDVVERRAETSRTTGAGRTSAVAVIERKDPNGRLVEVARRTAERTEAPGAIRENAAEFEPGPAGQMRMVRQIVSATTIAPDGSSRQQVDIFEPSAPGRVDAAGSPPLLTRRQVIETTVTPQGTVQILSAAVADVSNPGRVGPLAKVEQTVCTGECGKKK